MSRIKITLPERMDFSVVIPVRITDLNYGGHVGNDKILSLIHEARILFLASLGHTELNFSGAALIMADVAIEFKSELFYGDQLRIFVTTKEISRVGFDIFYKLMKNTGDLVAIGKTAMICFDYGKRKVVSLPQEAVNKLKEL